MFKLNRFFESNYDLLLESVLLTDQSFKKAIIDIYERYNDQVAIKIYRLLNKDIPTNINYLSMGKANDEISFVNDTQVSRMVDSGKDPFTSSRNNSKIGRAVRQLLAANNIEVTDKEIEQFVNTYKIVWDEANKPLNIELVSGEKIKEWYHESKYERGGGQLNNSCMRYPACQRYLDIYAKNPNQCQLVILKTEDNTKLLGRAILWKCSEKSTFGNRNPVKVDMYLDRIYTIFDYDREKIKLSIKKMFPDKKIISHLDSDDISGLTVSLDEAEFEKYPYMDSLFYVFPKLKYIAPQKNDTDLVFQCRATDGSKTVYNWLYSSRMRQYYPIADCVMVNSINSYMPTSECIRDYRGEWVYREDVIDSPLYGPINRANSIQTERWGAVPRNEIVEVKNGARTNIRMPKKLENIEFFRVNDKYSSTKYVIAEYAFSDIFNKKYLSSDKRHFTSYRYATSLCLLKMHKINEADVVPLGEISPCRTNAGSTRRLYSLPGSEFPVAVEYNVPELRVGTMSIAPAKSTGIIACEKDINAFRLRKKRASKGTTSPELLLPFAAMSFDYFLNTPITEDMKDFVRAKSGEAGNAETTDAKIELLTQINTYLYANSSDYQRNLRNAVLRGATDESLFKDVNKSIANFWSSRDTTIRQLLTDLPRAAAQNGALESMLNHFNGIHPFNIRKPLNIEEFKSVLLERREQMVCELYLRCVTRDRTRSAKSAARHYGNKSQPSRLYLESWSNEQFSGTIGTRINNSCITFYNNRFPQNDPASVMKCEVGYQKFVVIGDHDMFHNGLKAWDLFKRDHFNTLFPPIV